MLRHVHYRSPKLFAQGFEASVEAFFFFFNINYRRINLELLLTVNN